jgi:hypothetical protein
MFNRPMGVLRLGKYDVYQGLQLSEGGFVFETKTAMKVGDPILVSLVLPALISVVARAQVLYISKATESTIQYGAKFTSLQINQRRSIRNYVTAKTEKEAAEEVDDGSGVMSKWAFEGL